MQIQGNNERTGHFQMEIVHDYLKYKDDRAEYRIYIGKKLRRKLFMLDEKPGVVTKNLEIDLSTGNVYYDVVPVASGTVAYYYDKANRELTNFEVQRLLLESAKHGFTPLPEQQAAFEQLPCENWEEVLSELPEWKEILEHRYEELYLPNGEVHVLEVSEGDLADPEDSIRTFSGNVVKWKDMTGFSVMGKRTRENLNGVKHQFEIVRGDGKTALRYQNGSGGAEFFHEDAEYLRVLSPEEYRWLLTEVRHLAEDMEIREQVPARKENKAYMLLRLGKEEIVFTADDPEELMQADDLLLRFLKLEVEISGD